jgi:hypothetical protein
MSRLTRLSAREYGRLTPEQRKAVEVLRYGSPDAATRGEQKTILSWKRTAGETAAYARKLIGEGMMPGAAALRLGVNPDHLRRLLGKAPTPGNQPRNPFIHAKNSAPTDRNKGAGHPGDHPPIHAEKSGLTDEGKGRGRTPDHPDPDRVLYGGDPFTYDFEAALRSARSRRSGSRP